MNSIEISTIVLSILFIPLFIYAAFEGDIKGFFVNYKLNNPMKNSPMKNSPMKNSPMKNSPMKNSPMKNSPKSSKKRSVKKSSPRFRKRLIPKI